MSLHDSRQERNVFHQPTRWLDQIPFQRITPYFRYVQQWNEGLRKQVPRWAGRLRDTARHAIHNAHEMLPRWADALHDRAQVVGDALRDTLPGWAGSLRNAARYANRARREMSPRWEHMLQAITRHVDHVRRELLPRWVERAMRHARHARREMPCIWAGAWQDAAPYVDHVLHQALPEWIDTLRAASRHAGHSLNEMLPRWEQALRDGAQYAAHTFRILIVASAAFVDRHVPFSWRERDWRRNVANAGRRIPRWLATVLVGLAAIAFALNVASHSSVLANLHLPQPVATGLNVTSPVMLHQDGAPVATPTTSAYQVGIWTSASNPSASGTIHVYVRISQSNQPAQVAATLQVQQGGSSTSYGPSVTNAYGLATFTVSYSGLSSTSPIQLTASVSAGGQTYSAETVLVR